MAIKEWAKLGDGQSVPLERALAAFDQFILHDREGDLEEVSITPCSFSSVRELTSSDYCTARQCCPFNPS